MRKLVIVLSVVALALVSVGPASAHIDNRRIRWHTTWTTVRHADFETVKLKTRITNLSYKDRYDAQCEVKIWNASDQAFRVFSVSLRPRHYVERSHHVNLSGLSPTHTKVIHCHSA